jgi:hypothetical protein
LSTLVYFFASIFCFLKKKDVPVGIVVVKFIATVSVVTTFLVVMCALLPASGPMMIAWPTMTFLHVIDPLLALVSFCFFEITPMVKKKLSWLSMLSVLLYTAVIAPLASLQVIADPYKEIHLMDITASAWYEVTWKWCAILLGTSLVGFLFLWLRQGIAKFENKKAEKADEWKPDNAYAEDRGPQATPTHEIPSDDVIVIQDDEDSEAAEEEEEIKEEEEAKRSIRPVP